MSERKPLSTNSDYYTTLTTLVWDIAESLRIIANAVTKDEARKAEADKWEDVLVTNKNGAMTIERRSKADQSFSVGDSVVIDVKTGDQ
jgi:hypothetical protein